MCSSQILAWEPVGGGSAVFPLCTLFEMVDMSEAGQEPERIAVTCIGRVRSAQASMIFLSNSTRRGGGEGIYRHHRDIGWEGGCRDGHDPWQDAVVRARHIWACGMLQHGVTLRTVDRWYCANAGPAWKNAGIRGFPERVRSDYNTPILPVMRSRPRKP